jgi:ribosome-associated toxin RatA of RatAB toxin-antitoxin module
MEPDLHKRYYFINHYKNKTPLFADGQVIIADSEDDLFTERSIYIAKHSKKFWTRNVTKKI